MIIMFIIIAAVLVVMGILIIIGKGDNLIAGYNTASKEERAKYNIKRLRGLIGGLLIAMAPMMFLFSGEPSIEKSLSAAFLITVLAIVIVILANTWAKKR